MADRLDRIFGDILTLEINLVVKDEMTARRMPTYAHALLDITQAYEDHLCELVVAAGSADPGWARVAGLREQFSPGGEVTLSMRRLEEIRTCAREIEARVATGGLGAAAGFDDRTTVLLRRIYRNVDQLKPILARDANRRAVALVDPPPPDPALTRADADRVTLPLTPDEVLTVRKVWEVGVEEVVMQTVVQLDGDVVTRVTPGAMAPDFEVGRGLHAAAVTTAVAHWQQLGRVAVDFAATIFTKLTGR